MPIRAYLPRRVTDSLFGDRTKWGKSPNVTDPMWIEYVEREPEIYRSLQKSGVGKIVNNAGYKILRNIDLNGKSILEFGPGELTHHDQWNGTPERFVLVDRSAEYLRSAESKLRAMGFPVEQQLVGNRQQIALDVPSGSIDIVLSFASLEHLHPLDDYMNEFTRVLKPGGLLVGSIPAEGGLAWGMGRYFTSRRWFEKNTSIDIARIMCWEHPNFADEVMTSIRKRFKLQKATYWPMLAPSIDANLVISFVATRRA